MNENGMVLKGPVRDVLRRLMVVFAVITTGLAGLASGAGAATATIKYTYDACGRLLTASYGSSGKFTYTYDKAGNMSSAVCNASRGQSVGLEEEEAAAAEQYADPDSASEFSADEVAPDETPGW